MRDDFDFEPEARVEEPFEAPAAFTTNVAFVALPALALAACGGGSAEGGADPTPTAGASAPPPPVVVAPPTSAQAGRFLAQSSMGSTKADISKVQSGGYAAWLDEQFAMGREIKHWDWLVARGYNVAANRDNHNGFDAVMWRQFIASPDQLRQRVGLALLDFLVVSVNNLASSWAQFSTAAYVDILWDNAFGNFRTLIEQVSLSPAMSNFLTYMGNRKANPSTGSRPDENYAREVMQLFTLGVNKLNNDGTVQMSGGNAAETYTQDDVSGLARVFTGFVLDSTDNTTPDRYRRPLIQNASQHETGEKVFLGTTIPAGTNGMDSLKLALDAIFAHPNVPPFVSRQLIQRLVTSNPTPAYVARIANVFINNGSGVRGDLKAVVRAILLDNEARSDTVAAGTSFGKLREPVTRLTGFARAFNATSANDTWGFGDTSSSQFRIAQSPGRSPSVFNFFRPGFTPPNTSIATANLVAPEFQIANELSVIAYINFLHTIIPSTTRDPLPNYADVLPLAATPQALVEEVNLLVAGGQVSAATLTAIRTAVESIPAASPDKRVHTAILLVMASPEYITLR